jgi:hypothetical protein
MKNQYFTGLLRSTSLKHIRKERRLGRRGKIQRHAIMELMVLN